LLIGLTTYNKSHHFLRLGGAF